MVLDQETYQAVMEALGRSKRDGTDPAEALYAAGLLSTPAGRLELKLETQQWIWRSFASMQTEWYARFSRGKTAASLINDIEAWLRSRGDVLRGEEKP